MGTKNFPAYKDGVACTASSTSPTTKIALTAADVASPDVMIYNPGPLDIRVKTGVVGVPGIADVAASNLSFPVPAGAMVALRKESGSTHVSGYSASASAQTFHAWCGEGA